MKLTELWGSHLFGAKALGEDDVEYTDRLLKGRTEANRYLVGMALFFLLADAVLVVLSFCGVFPADSLLWQSLLLGGAILCHAATVAVGYASHFEGKNTPAVLFTLLFLSFGFLSAWIGNHACLWFVIPVLLSVRYYDVFFSLLVSVFAEISAAIVSFACCLLREQIGSVSYATAAERFQDCFDFDFWICAAILAACGVTAVCSTVGGKQMVREEAEIAAAQAKSEVEVAEARMQIMISQIQPHFIYNTLNTICYLCGKEPETAQNALSDFADYLRENLNFSGKAEMIPFERELAHIEKYLSLEKMRFEDELNVEMNIECSSFEIPSLTVQPLVENAVKHGVCHRDGGGTVRIEAKDALDCYQVIISDDGVGFDPAQPYPPDNRRHIGLENTRTRLEKMCSATMKVESAVGKGTKITISIPKEYYYDDSRC